MSMTVASVGVSRQDRHVGDDPAGEEPFDGAFRFRVAGRARLQIRLDQGQAVVVLLPGDVEIARLQAGIDFAAGHGQGDEVFLLSKSLGNSASTLAFLRST